MNHYRHTQFGTLSMSILLVAVIMISLLGSNLGWHPVGIIVFLLLIAALPLFYCLTVDICETHIEIRFGIGLIRKRFLLQEIKETYPIRNSWLSGWGIRLLLNGTWLYNVSGLDAVEIVMSSGKHYQIGTDEPKELAQAITAAKDKS